MVKNHFPNKNLIPKNRASDLITIEYMDSVLSVFFLFAYTLKTNVPSRKSFCMDIWLEYLQ